MSKRQSINICEGVNFSYINERKFKTARISFTMFLPLNKNTVSVNAVLSDIIDRSCGKYPNFDSFNKELEKLYGANIYSSVDKLGETQVLTVSGVCINDNATFDNSEIINNIAKFLCNVIFKPCIENGRFRPEDVNQAKRQIIDDIKAEYNDKKIYAKRRCEQLMCKNEKFGISKYGEEESVNLVSSEDVFNAWENALKTSRIEIMISGSEDYQQIYDMFLRAFSSIERKDIVNCETQIIDTVSKVQEFKDVMNVSQCKLTMGFRTSYAISKCNIYPMKVMCALLGGTPHSKLFLNVREELSLCYYCSASYNKEKGIIFIESGVEKGNIEKAKQEILKQLDSIKSGDFTDDQLTATKIYLIQMFDKIQDSLSLLDNWYVMQSLSKKIYTPDEAIQAIKNITKNEIIEAAKNVKLDTVYMLIGNGEEQ